MSVIPCGGHNQPVTMSFRIATVNGSSYFGCALGQHFIFDLAETIQTFVLLFTVVICEKNYFKRTTCNLKGEGNTADVLARSFITQGNGALAISQSTCLFPNMLFSARELTWRFFFRSFLKKCFRGRNFVDFASTSPSQHS